jgi:tRNA threonylcarbamoyladenosine biosynthesis protein TsaB
MVEEAMGEAGLDGPRALGGVVALAGPGSFTGLRVGLATALGLHQALGVPAAGLPSLEVLAAAAPEDAGRVVAVVDAQRGEWVAQEFVRSRPGETPTPVSRAARIAAAELAAGLRDRRPAVVVGFGLAALAAALGEAAGIALLAPPALAPVAVHLVARRPPAWDAATLTRPLYFRPPAVTLPRRAGAPGR